MGDVSPAPRRVTRHALTGDLAALSRRSFLRMGLTAAFGSVLGGVGRAAAAVDARRGMFAARAALLYGVFRFEESGTIDETIDRVAGRYEVRISGRGHEMTTEIESTGVLRDGRWAPSRFADRFVVYGRESRLEITHDYDRGQIVYRGRSETFLLRRIRTTDDTVPIPPGTHVDDVVSATLNYSEGRWVPEPDGTLATRVVRRQRIQGEGPDDASRRYRAELVPFALRVVTGSDGRQVAELDLTRFSSWARDDEPGRIVFGSDRRPETITASLILGTSLTIRIQPAAAS
jgi:hypothetical protein